MRLASSNLLGLLAVTVLTDALPFIPKPRTDRPLVRRKATYSVVPVDGGSTGVAAATTITEPASALPPVTETQLSTIVMTAFETPSTVVVTITATPSPPQSKSIAGSTSAPSCSETTTTTTLTSGSTIYTTSTTTMTSATTEVTTLTSVTAPATVVSVTTLPPAVTTITASPSIIPYDNGMWHTTYYHPIYTTSSSSSYYSETPTTSFYPYPSTMTSPSTASPSLDTNIGIPWNGTWALGPREVVKKTPKKATSAPTHTIAMFHPKIENE